MTMAIISANKTNRPVLLFIVLDLRGSYYAGVIG